MTAETEFGVIDFINDIDRGAHLLPEFLKNSPKIIALIEAILPEIQELHDAQKDIATTINIFDATGLQLDNIFGEILNLGRVLGQLDDDYRIDLLVQIVKIAKSAEILTMKRIYKTLLNASSVRLFEYQPATFKLEASVSAIPSDSKLTKIRSTLSEAKQGGNGMLLSVNDAEPFRLVVSNPQTNSPNGLTDGTFTGGTLSTQF